MSMEISETGWNSVGGAKQAKKRLIVCCDGTWNDSISSDSPLTNVSRISRLITDIDENSFPRVPQVVYYHTGVGSGTSAAGNVVDGMSGRGISANIRNAYSFICYNFSNEQDEIVLIGFSRGAFTVQAVATLIADVGLLTKSGLGHLCEVYKLWKIKPHGNGNHTSDPRSSLREKCDGLSKLSELRTGIKVKVCAVWDAVGSLGFPVPDPFPQKASRRLAHVNSTLCTNIEVAIQALALNERRKHFQVTVWKADGSVNNRILKQCWFLGTHSDVGGGNKDTGLANITLVWIITQLRPYVGFDIEALRAFTSKRVKKASEESREFDMPKHMSARSIALPLGIQANIGANVPVSIGAGISRRSRYELPWRIFLEAEVIHFSHRASHSVWTNTGFTGSWAGKIRNSTRGVFVLGGSRPRKPCQYLMSEERLHINPKDNPVPTNETIHYTVRVLLASGLWECGALTKYEMTTENSTVNWTLLHKDKRKTEIHLSEDPYCIEEQDLLENWMKAENEKRKESSQGHTSSDRGAEDSTILGILLPFLKLREA